MQGPTLTWNHCSVLYTSKWDASYLCALFKVRPPLLPLQRDCRFWSLALTYETLALLAFLSGLPYRVQGA